MLVLAAHRFGASCIVVLFCILVHSIFCVFTARNNCIVHCASSDALFQCLFELCAFAIGKNYILHFATLYFVRLETTGCQRKLNATHNHLVSLTLPFNEQNFLLLSFHWRCLSSGKCQFAFNEQTTVSLHCLLSVSVSLLPANQTPYHEHTGCKETPGPIHMLILNSNIKLKFQVTCFIYPQSQLHSAQCILLPSSQSLSLTHQVGMVGLCTFDSWSHFSCPVHTQAHQL